MRTELPERWSSMSGVRPGVTGVETGLVPDPLASLEAWARWNHHDVAELSNGEIWAELHRLEAALASGVRHAWLAQRWRVLRAEQGRRRKR